MPLISKELSFCGKQFIPIDDFSLSKKIKGIPFDTHPKYDPVPPKLSVIYINICHS